MSERIGLYPGTFDPLTNGHVDIISRAIKLVDRLVIGIAVNDQKKPLFSTEERVEIVSTEMKQIALPKGATIEVMPFGDLLMSCAERINANIIIRGLRAVSDFEYEFQMVGMNTFLNDEIETVFLMADPHHQAIASRLVKEIARLDGDVSKFVPPAVAARLTEKFGN